MKNLHASGNFGRRLSLLLIISATSACGSTTSNASSEAAGAGMGGSATDVEPAEPNCAVDLASHGSRHCAVYQDGNVWCWGADASGEATGSADSPTPVRVEGVSGATRVFVGPAHVCATADGGLSCWGNNDSAQIDRSGRSPLGPTVVPFHSSGTPAPLSSVGLGGKQTCIGDAIGHVYCRGFDERGELAQGAQVGPLGSARNRLFTGDFPMVVEGGVVYVIDDWNQPSSLPFYGADNEIVHVGSPSCVIKLDGSLWCGAYSLDDAGELARKEELSEGSLWVGGGDFYVCALTDSRRVWCDGWNPAGQLGRGTVDSSAQLLAGDWVVGLEGVRVLSPARFSACALTEDGRVWCWGSYGPMGGAAAPVQVSACEAAP